MKKINKLGKIFIVFFMLLSLSFADLIKVNAWNSTIPHEFTRVKEIMYPQWWASKVPGIRGWSTWSTMYNGKWAYCLESSKNTPGNGQYVADVIENNEAVRKLMYYGFGGPAPYGEFANGFDLKAVICPDDTYLTNDDVKYLLTHIFLSGAYCGDWNGFDEQKFNQVFGGNYGSNIMGIYRRILALPEPTAPKFSPSVDPLGLISEFNATVNTVTNEQITNTVKLEGNSNATINIPLPANTTIHVGEATQTGGVASVRGGQSFYFTAPLNVEVQDLQLTDVTGSGCEGFVALAIRTGSSTTQTEGSWDWDPDANRLFTQIKWIHGSKISLEKKDNYNEIISNATFNLMEWNNTLSEYEEKSQLTYNADKHIYESELLQYTSLNDGKFKIEEIVPDGYLNSSKFVREFKLDECIEKNTINADIENQNATIKISSSVFDPHIIKYEVFDAPDNVTSIQFPTWSESGGQDDIEWVTLSKSNDGVWRAQKYMAEIGNYEIHGYYNTANQLNVNFFTTSVNSTGFTFEAINKRIVGKVSLTKTDKDTGEKLANAQFEVIAKNDITTPQGTVVLKAGEVAGNITTDENGYGELGDLNLGAYILKETVPPDGYHVTADQEFTLTAENNDIEIINSNLDVKDNANNLKIKKIDKDTGKALANAKFELFNVTANKKAGTYTSSANGEINISKLVPATYYIQEIQAPDGYKLNDTKYYFDINNQGNANISNINGTVDDGTFFIDANGDMTITVKNEINLFNLRITKKNDAGKLLENAEFTLYSDKECTQEITKGSTNEEGKVNFDKITVGEYYLKETKAPDGYRMLENAIKVSLKNVDGKFTFFINDEAIKENDDNNSLTIENGLYTANMTVVNQRGSLLPATGSTATLILVSAGTFMCLYGLSRKVKGKKNENQ